MDRNSAQFWGKWEIEVNEKLRWKKKTALCDAKFPQNFFIYLRWLIAGKCLVNKFNCAQWLNKTVQANKHIMQ